MFFAADSIWNKRLPDDAPLDLISDAVVSALADRAIQTRLWSTRGHGISTFNYHDWTTGVFIASEKQSTQRVTVDRLYNPFLDKLREAFAEVPIPCDTRPSPPYPGDNNIVVYQPSTDKMWEAWHAGHWEVDGPRAAIGQHAGVSAETLNRPGWHIGYGGAMEHVSTNKGIFDDTAWKGMGKGWGGSASKLPFVGGLITRQEGLDTKEGKPISHALQFHVLAGGKRFRWPAQAGDGWHADPNAPCEGMIFRLPHDYDVDVEPDPFLREVARAIRDYGFIIVDTAGACAFRCESRSMIPGTQHWDAPDVWLGADNKIGPNHNGVLTDWPTKLAARLPWTKLQLIASSYRP